MDRSVVRNTARVDLPLHRDSRGGLVAIEGGSDIPFDIRRVYYITDVPKGERRGYHAHAILQQILVCVHGSVKILVDDGHNSDVVLLDQASKGLYIGPMVWREMFDFSEGSVLLVLASEHYDPSDYEKDYGRFKEEALRGAQGK